MLEFIKELYDYNDDCNRRVIAIFSENRDKMPDRAVKVMDHMLIAHHIWNRRTLGEEIENPVWGNLEDGSRLDFHEQNQQESHRIMASTGLDDVINYRNSKGVEYSNTVRDTLFHIINHSTYHRGQLASLFREAGAEPAVTDYIFYKR